MPTTKPTLPAEALISNVAGRHGYLTTYDISTLSSYEDSRLTPILVRCGAKRFTCAAQYVEEMIAAIEAGGDYVRDVMMAPGSRLAEAVEARIRFNHDL